MKKLIFLSLVSSQFFLYNGASAQTTPDQSWSKENAKKWYELKGWLNGLQWIPHESIDQQEFARQYHLNRIFWYKAFLFLREHDLHALPKGKYPIDGDNVYATVTEDSSKDFKKTQWESHRKYIDLQCVIMGEEKMGKCPVSKATVIRPYDESKDVANYSAEGEYYLIPANSFIIFFPSDAHRPNITPGGNKVVKKIVIKIKVAG